MICPRSPHSHNGKARPAPGLNRWLGWTFKLGLVSLMLLTGLAIYLDVVIQEKFSDRRRTIPTKAYARPLELFSGLKLSREDFLREPDALGCRREPSVGGPGTVSVAASVIKLNTRGFQFYENTEPAQRVCVRFNGNYVSGLNQANGKELVVTHPEPLLIGGLYPAYHEDRIPIKLDQVPTYLISTLITVESHDFWNHHGVSLKSMARAVWVNTTTGQLRQGGSTLTQQLVKNFFLSNERSPSRKINEAIMAVLLELHYGKRDILGPYFNEVFLGQDRQRTIHSFGLISQHFLSQPLAELKLDQVVLLVDMVRGPSHFNPRRYPGRALARRNLVPDVSAEQGVATQQEVGAAKQRSLGVTWRGGMANSSYPAFLDLVKRQLRQDYRNENLAKEELRIFISFDPILQKKVETSVNETLRRLSGCKKVDQVEAVMVVTSPETGETQVLIGSRDPRFADFNQVLDAVRPIDSLIKPAVYLIAFKRPSKYTLTTWMQDGPSAVKGQDGQVRRPRNYDRRSHGVIFLYQDLTNSYNLSTAKLGLDVDVPNVLQTIARLGINHDWPACPLMLLGIGSLNPTKVVTMYQTIVSNDSNTPLRGTRSVLTADDRSLERYPFQAEQRSDLGVAYLVQNAMQRVMREDTRRSVYSQLLSSLTLAGKTGVSNDPRDSRFFGFGGDLQAVVWLDRDDNSKTPPTGATGALQVWTSLMRKTHP